MRIAVYYSKSTFASWNMGPGLCAALNRMGHEATPCPIPGGIRELRESDLEFLKKQLPTLEALRGLDAVLLSGTEHLAPLLEAVYGQYAWKNELSVPKVSWYHESFFRSDYSIDFGSLAGWADEHYFPAAQDAEFHDQEHFAKGRSHWLPFGVDTEVFRPVGLVDETQEHYLKGFIPPQRKQCDCAFIGLLYPLRASYVGKLGAHLHDVELRIGQVGVVDLGGVRERDQAELLAENYRQIRVFVNLPSLSQLLVSKVLEVMACGTFLLTPLLEGTEATRRNMAPFESGKHLIYYRAANLPYLHQLMRDHLGDEKGREAIARAGCEEVYKNHRLENRLGVILERLGARQETLAAKN